MKKLLIGLLVLGNFSAFACQDICTNAGLVDHITKYTKYENNIDEEIIITKLLMAPELTKVQLSLVKVTFDKARYENNIDEQALIIDIIRNGSSLSLSHEKLMRKVITKARYENNVDEELVLHAIIRTNNLPSITADRLIALFQSARYNNNIDETKVMLQILHRCSR